jgi:hypothetical protein
MHSITYMFEEDLFLRSTVRKEYASRLEYILGSSLLPRVVFRLTLDRTVVFLALPRIIFPTPSLYTV